MWERVTVGIVSANGQDFFEVKIDRSALGIAMGLRGGPGMTVSMVTRIHLEKVETPDAPVAPTRPKLSLVTEV